jgi:opacity protein-like surface antigen
MASIRTVVLAGSLGLASTSFASAADLRGPIRHEPLPVHQEEFAGGWYLRGDVGVGNQSLKRLSNSQIEAPDRVPITHLNAGFTSAPLIGAGVGYVFNNWLRADVTGEYRSAAFKGLSSYPGGVGFTSGSFAYTANQHALVGLANLYLDLGTWSGITPFIGGGIGLANITVDDFTLTNAHQQAVVYGPRGNRTNFAWALHAGAAVDVTDNLKVELGYRYLRMGDAAHGTPLTDAISKGKDVSEPWVFRRLESHDVKLGMRWMLDAPARVAQAWPEEPLIRKY